MDSESMNTAWGTAGGRLGASGLIAVAPASTKIIDDLIYQRLSPADRYRVDQDVKQRTCAPPLCCNCGILCHAGACGEGCIDMPWGIVADPVAFSRMARQ